MSGILVVGDSISFGEHLPNRVWNAWPSVLGRERNVDVVNLSVCGDTTRLALERAAEWQAMMRPTVIFQFGVNDANRWKSDRGMPRVGLDAFAGNLVDMALRALAFEARQIVFATIAIHERPVPPRWECDLYSEVVRRAWPHVLDLEALGPLPTIDGLHLTEVGHARVAEAARDLLEKIDWRQA